MANSWTAAVGPLTVGTSTAATQLDGQLIAAASDIIVPSRAKSLLAVRPWQTSVTPTAHQSFIASVRLASSDVAIGDYEILAPPIGASLGTNITTFADLSYWFPINLAVSGGQHIQAYGQAQIANTAAPYVGADLLWSDGPPLGPQAHFKLAGIFSGGGPTSTGTSAGSVAGGTIQLNSGSKVFAWYGYATNSTPTAVKPITGYFTLTSPEMGAQTGLPNTHTFDISPVQGFLGTTTTGDFEYLSKAEGLSIPYTAPTTLTTSIYLDVALTAAGNFSNGVGYF